MKKYQDLAKTEIKNILGFQDRAEGDFKQMIYTVRSKRTTQARNMNTGSINMEARTPVNAFEIQASVLAASAVWDWMSKFDVNSTVDEYCYNTSRFSFFTPDYFQTITLDDYMDTDPMDNKQSPIFHYSTAITVALASKFISDVINKEDPSDSKRKVEAYALSFIYTEYARFIARGFEYMGAFENDEDFNESFKFDVSRIFKDWTTFDILEKVTGYHILDNFARITEEDDSWVVSIDKEYVPFLVEFTLQWNAAIKSWASLLLRLKHKPFPMKLGVRHTRPSDITTTTEDK